MMCVCVPCRLTLTCFWSLLSWLLEMLAYTQNPQIHSHLRRHNKSNNIRQQTKQNIAFVFLGEVFVKHSIFSSSRSAFLLWMQSWCLTLTKFGKCRFIRINNLLNCIDGGSFNNNMKDTRVLWLSPLWFVFYSRQTARWIRTPFIFGFTPVDFTSSITDN